uniref:Glycine-rich RNA-binding protein 2-like n=1 Tax=Rhizophora mucronata TaxID=61149 RepID=A0A2P2KTI9_RHIMU
MAFLSKVGNILRQTSAKQINVELPSSRPSLYQAIRWMSSSKVFVGGVSFSVCTSQTFCHFTPNKKEKAVVGFLSWISLHMVTYI